LALAQLTTSIPVPENGVGGKTILHRSMWEKNTEDADLLSRSNKKIKVGTKKITLINEEISYSKNGFQQQKFLATGIIYKDSLVGSYFFNLVSLEEGQVEDYIFEE
jgi:hypothetical protein